MKKIILAFLISFVFLIGFAQNKNDLSFGQIQPNEQKEFSELKIYPNPCKSDKITVESFDNAITEVSISNIAGKQIFLKKFPYPENKKQLELTDVPDGIYLVKVKTDNNKRSVKKLIVSKE